MDPKTEQQLREFAKYLGSKETETSGINLNFYLLFFIKPTKNYESIFILVFKQILKTKTSKRKSSVPLGCQKSNQTVKNQVSINSD
jgi:hypothetical protein